MADYPERINISPVHRQEREDDFYLVDRKAFPGKGVEYIRADHARALVAEAYEVPAKNIELTCDGLISMGYDAFSNRVRELVPSIRALTPADAQSARAARDAEVREQALRDALEAVSAADSAELAAHGTTGIQDRLFILIGEGQDHDTTL